MGSADGKREIIAGCISRLNCSACGFSYQENRVLAKPQYRRHWTQTNDLYLERTTYISFLQPTIIKQIPFQYPLTVYFQNLSWNHFLLLCYNRMTMKLALSNNTSLLVTYFNWYFKEQNGNSRHQLLENR